MEAHSVNIALNDSQEIILETGRWAKQADGSVIVRAGDTMVLCTVCQADARPGIDFFPLTVEYREKSYSAGKIPGGFFKRPGRPYEKEVIGCRLTDRPIRPLFPKGFKNEVQLILSVLSFDGENEPDVLAITGASAALTLSSIPFEGPVGAVRIGYRDGAFVTNYSLAEEDSSELDLVVAGTEDAITMVECGARGVSEDLILEALSVAHERIKELCRGQRELQEKAGKPKIDFVADLCPPEIIDEVRRVAMPKIIEASHERGKFAVQAKLDEAKEAMEQAFAERVEAEEVQPGHLREAFEEVQKSFFRKLILEENKRPDGRKTDEVRPISTEVSVLPRTHGSAVFTRGETQSLGVLTLGISDDEQIIESLHDTYRDRFLLHYNFPPFSVGEVRFLRGPGRREIGHGTLARRSLEHVIPSKDDFPYTIRVVSEILESNGSSSMATVCAGCMALMDAGVPIREAVAGIAMGMVMSEDGSTYRILTDIQGWEDHYGDMDFKVAGTRDGITALQMDIKVKGMDLDKMGEALAQARIARLHILEKMAEAIDKPRDDLSPYAPRIISIPIKPEKIGAVIGPGGKTIRHIQETTGVRVEIDDVANRVNIVSTDGQASLKARGMVEAIIEEPEIGKIYNGRVVRVTKFGAFVEILPNQDGLVHISQLDFGHVKRTEDICDVGDIIPVKLTGIDDQGRINLSRRDALAELGEGPSETYADSSSDDSRDRGHRRDSRDRGHRRDSRDRGHRRDSRDRGHRRDSRDRGHRRDSRDGRDKRDGHESRIPTDEER